MSCDIISIGSSDEDYDEPPLKKIKQHILSECTLIPYKKSGTIVEVCDSDSEDDTSKLVPANDTCVKEAKPVKTNSKTDEIVSLTDDDEDNERKSKEEKKDEDCNKKNSVGQETKDTEKQFDLSGSSSDISMSCSDEDIKNNSNDHTESKEEVNKQNVATKETSDPVKAEIENKIAAKEIDLNGVDSVMVIDETDEEEDKEKPIKGISDSIVIDESSSDGESKNDHSSPQEPKSTPNSPNKKEPKSSTTSPNKKEPKSSTTSPNEKEAVPSKSSDKLSPYAPLLKNLIRIVEDSVANSKFEEIIHKQFPSIQRYFKSAESNLDKTFEKLLEENMEKAKKSAAQAVIAINNVKDYIKTITGHSYVEVDEKNVLKVRKLEKTINLLLKKIKELDEAECNLSDDEDSTYMQLDRYQNRLKKVHERYCKYLKKNPNSGRLTYDKISFSHSGYNQINLAIGKKFKNSQYFPSYYEVENVISEAVKDHNLELSENLIKVESEKCFKKLGEIMQKRRKTELYQTHHAFIENTEDPAGADTSLENTLKKNFADGKEKIEKICQLYASKQDLGEDKEDSENSGKSKGSESEEDSTEKDL